MTDFPEDFSTTFTISIPCIEEVLACPHCRVYPVERRISDEKMRWDRVWYAPWRRRPAHAVTCKSCGKRIGWSWSIPIEQAMAALRKGVLDTMADDLMSWMAGTEEPK